jgi:hypothetical protein
MFRDLSKYIEIRYHFIKDKDHKRAMVLQYIPTEEQVA